MDLGPRELCHEEDWLGKELVHLTGRQERKHQPHRQLVLYGTTFPLLQTSETTTGPWKIILNSQNRYRYLETKKINGARTYGEKIHCLFIPLK